MWKRFKKWRERRQHLKAIQYSFQILRSLYPHLDRVTQHLLVKAIEELITDYSNEYGNTDGVAEFYFDRLEYIVNKYNSLSV
jgi:hypothetical protein